MQEKLPTTDIVLVDRQGELDTISIHPSVHIRDLAAAKGSDERYAILYDGVYIIYDLDTLTRTTSLTWAIAPHVATFTTQDAAIMWARLNL